MLSSERIFVYAYHSYADPADLKAQNEARLAENNIETENEIRDEPPSLPYGPIPNLRFSSTRSRDRRAREIRKSNGNLLCCSAAKAATRASRY